MTTGASSGGGTPEAVVTVQGGGGTTLGSATVRRSGGDLRCGYYAGTGSSGGDDWGVSLDLTTPVNPTKGRLYGFYCYDAANQVVSSQMVVFDPGDPLGGAFAAERALAQARRQLPLVDPQIETTPPVGTEHLIGLPTFLRVGGGWTQQSASASVGGVTATVTARPVRVAFDPGDGSPAVTCDGPGAAPDAAASGDRSCAHVYRHRSGGGSFALRATVTWEVRWQATTGAGGPLEPVTRTSVVPVEVVEAQAVLR